MYAANLYKYILTEEKNMDAVAKYPHYADNKEKLMQVNRVKKRLAAGKPLA